MKKKHSAQLIYNKKLKYIYVRALFVLILYLKSLKHLKSLINSKIKMKVFIRIQTIPRLETNGFKNSGLFLYIFFNSYA